MERFFNTAGPNNPEDSYTIDPLSRFDLDEILTLIRQKRYFVFHAPRQTGKTSCMLALRDYLNKEGKYIAVYANVEAGQASRNDKDTVVKSMVDNLVNEITIIMGDDKAENAIKSV
nr:ATP-binding protein [Bacteroidaceae bacterium]